MLTRKLVVVIGLLAVAVGVFQILFREKAEFVASTALDGNWIYAMAGLSLLMGVILSWGAAAKLVRIPRLVLLLGLLLLASGAFVAGAPAFARDLANSLFFYRGNAYRVMVVWAGGILRILLGFALVYAGLRPPKPRTPKLGSIVPLA